MLLGLKNSKDFEFSFKGVKEDLIYLDLIYNPETKTIEKKIKLKHLMA